MLELAVGILLAAGAVYFVLRPILHPDWASERAGPEAADEGEDPDDDFSARAVAVRALREIEFDRATGKLSDTDYDELKTKYTAEALAALRAEGGSRESPAPTVQRASAVAGSPRDLRPASACPVHGPRSQADAEFCSDCGRRLAAGSGFCARCGSSLENGAHYCHSCGARVAA